MSRGGMKKKKGVQKTQKRRFKTKDSADIDRE